MGLHSEGSEKPWPEVFSSTREGIHVDRTHMGFGILLFGLAELPPRLQCLTTCASVEMLLRSQIPRLKNGDDAHLLELL